MDYINTETQEYPVTERAIRLLNPNVSFPTPFVAPEPYQLVFGTPAPTIDSVAQAARETAPVKTAKGHWEQQWEVVDLDAEVVAANQAAVAMERQSRIAADVERLWQAADAYVASYISGVAIGLLTLGMIQQKPTALAITAWSQAIWTEYYVRKAAVLEGADVDLDFSFFGPMPHSVPELQAEVLA